VTSETSPDAEDALAAEVAERILESGEIEKYVQKHTNRESAKLRKRQDVLEQETAPLLERYQGHIDDGMTPAEAKRAIEIDDLIRSNKSPGGDMTDQVPDQTPDSVGALSGDDAKTAASSLLKRIGVTGSAAEEILEDVGRRVSFSSAASLEDTVYDRVKRWNERQSKVSETQAPVSQSTTVTPATPEAEAVLREAYEKERTEWQKAGGGNDQLIEIRQKYRLQGLKI
jgi:hypothetical protein